MDVFEAILARRSIREYLPRPVEKDKLSKLLEAGRLAPSACNEQHWKFAVISDPNLIGRMGETCGVQPFVAKAPLLLAVCADGARDMLCGQPARTVDCSIALSFMLLEAVELGLSMCWLGRFDSGAVKEALSIPPSFDVVALATIGYPAESPAPRPRKALDELVIFNGWEA